MGQRLIIDVAEDSRMLEISGEGDGFLPGEVPLILEEAAAQVRRVEYLNNMYAMIQKQKEQQTAAEEARNVPDILVARGRLPNA